MQKKRGKGKRMQKKRGKKKAEPRRVDHIKKGTKSPYANARTSSLLRGIDGNDHVLHLQVFVQAILPELAADSTLLEAAKRRSDIKHVFKKRERECVCVCVCVSEREKVDHHASRVWQQESKYYV